MSNDKKHEDSVEGKPAENTPKPTNKEKALKTFAFFFATMKFLDAVFTPSQAKAEPAEKTAQPSQKALTQDEIEALVNKCVKENFNATFKNCMNEKLGATSKEETLTRLETLSKVLIGISMILYILGFFIVSFHLAKYGAVSLHLVRAQYMLAGFWMMMTFSLPLIIWIYFYLVYRSYEDFKNNTLKLKGFLFRIAVELLLCIFSYLLIVALYFLAILLIGHIPNDNNPQTLINFFWRLVKDDGSTLFFRSLVVFSSLIYFFATAYINKDKPQDLTLMAVLIITVSAVYLLIFSSTIYPEIPDTLGGGKFPKVRYVFKEGKTKVLTENFKSACPGIKRYGDDSEILKKMYFRQILVADNSLVATIDECGQFAETRPPVEIKKDLVEMTEHLKED
jgi:hypothetical protein